MGSRTWLEARQYTPEKMDLARRVLEVIRSGRSVEDAVRHYPLPDGSGYLGKHHLVAAYLQLTASGEWPHDQSLLARIRLKPIRSLSGVSVVTVLTKPHTCPGECIFCPTDVRMPKSYLPDEPGAMRGFQHKFDPYDQVVSRLKSLQDVGHPTDKIELLILGGTWSAYPRDYQEWFILRCFDALNGAESETLTQAQTLNETAERRNVGLAIETRPDSISSRHLAWLRYLGVTKVQMGVQSLDDRILDLNKRGHTVAESRGAVALLRAAGFKIVLHWMPNMLGATLESDREDFERLWDDLYPDELKIYPTQLLADTELYEYWQRGEFTPYTSQELIDLITRIKLTIPRYCRVNRVIRDIPSTHVVEGNKRTSLRQDIQREMKARGERCECIRCREIRGHKVEADDLQKQALVYTTTGTEEHFLSFITADDKLTGFLRLSLPKTTGEGYPDTGMVDLQNAAIIREVHIYGQSLDVGDQQAGAAQHTGLGTALINWSEEIARENGYARLAVISAVGTRQYYEGRGFERGKLYLVKNLP